MVTCRRRGRVTRRARCLCVGLGTPGASGAPGGGGGGLRGPGHGAEGPPRGKMNKGWLELESDPGEEGAGWLGVGETGWARDASA